MSMKIHYRMPHSAIVHYDNGAPAQLQGWRADALYLTLSNCGTAKNLERLGGRNAFEQATQRDIVDTLDAHERPGRKRVLIIGDSIRMRIVDGTGYGLHVYRRLLEEANLTHIPHNCGGTEGVLQFLENWLSCEPDIVHINAGLHDLAYSPGEGRPPSGYNTVEQYAENLGIIIDRIRQRRVQSVIWGLNTPVQDQWHQVNSTGRPRSRFRKNDDVRTYNDAALEIMKKRYVPVTDMFSPLWNEGLESVLIRDGVHLAHRGSEILGELVAKAVRSYL